MCGQFIRYRFFRGVFVMTIQSPVANAAITVLCSNSSRAVMDELIPQFQRASGHKVAIKYDTAQLTLKRIAQGEVADVVILNAAAIDELTQQGRVASASRRQLARCR